MNASNQKVVEMHKIAEHAHLAAAEQNGKGDHLNGHQFSRIAHEHTTEAFRLSQTADSQADHRDALKHAGRSLK